MNEEQKEQLLELVSGLSTADELRDFAKETLGVRVAHNAGADAIREKILAHLEPDGDQSGDEETDAPNDAPAAAEDNRSQSSPKDSDEEAPKPRRLKNSKNGRVFGYTKALAKLAHMKEV